MYGPQRHTRVGKKCPLSFSEARRVGFSRESRLVHERQLQQLSGRKPRCKTFNRQSSPTHRDPLVGPAQALKAHADHEKEVHRSCDCHASQNGAC